VSAPGIIASLLEPRAPFVVDDTLATADFLTPHYSVAGAAVTAADIIDQPGQVTGTGLQILADADVVNILGAFLAVLTAAEWTLVIEWDHGTTSSSMEPLVVTGPGNDNAVQILRQNGFSGHFLTVEDFAGSHFRGSTDSSGAIGDGIHKLALTRVDAKLVFSIDGRAIVSNTSDSFSLAPTTAAFGGYPGDTVNDDLYIRSLRIYAAVSDATLPLLSA